MKKTEYKKIYDELYKELLERINKNMIISEKIIDYLLDIILEKERKQNIKILPYLNLENVSFNDKNIEDIDFRNTNAKIDPQTIKNKSLKNCILNGDFKGKSFEDVHIIGTDFTNTTNVNLDPQTVKNKNLCNTKLKGIDFKEKSFDGVHIHGTDFRGAKNLNLDPQTVYGKVVSCTKLFGDFKGKSFDGAYIEGADFSYTSNAKINPQELLFKSLENVNATGVDFGNYSFEGVNVKDAQLKNSLNCTYEESKHKNIQKKIGKLK